MSQMEASESTKCFPFLVDNLPKWLDDVRDVEKKIKVRREEAARISVPAPTPKRTGSNESIRVNDAVNGTTRRPSHGPFPFTNTPADITSAPAGMPSSRPTNTLSVDQSITPLVANRKRKPASLMSSVTSIPTKYRSRNMIIVYYDSEVQKCFEQMVRNIGSGRNMLRKGKMQARMDAFTGSMDNMMSALGRIGGLSPGFTGASAATTRALNAAARKIEYAPCSPLHPASSPALPNGRSKIRPYLASATSSPSPAAPSGSIPDVNRATGHYDALDKRLEIAQSLAEKGAHQFLREGECPAEIDGIRSELSAALKWCQDAVAAMKQVEAETRVSLEEVRAEIEREERKDRQQRDKEDVKGLQTNISPTVNINGLPTVAVGVATIEVDSDVEDELEIKLPPIRRLART